MSTPGLYETSRLVVGSTNPVLSSPKFKSNIQHDFNQRHKVWWLTDSHRNSFTHWHVLNISSDQYFDENDQALALFMEREASGTIFVKIKQGWFQTKLGCSIDRPTRSRALIWSDRDILSLQLLAPNHHRHRQHRRHHHQHSLIIDSLSSSSSMKIFFLLQLCASALKNIRENPLFKQQYFFSCHIAEFFVCTNQKIYGTRLLCLHLRRLLQFTIEGWKEAEPMKCFNMFKFTHFCRNLYEQMKSFFVQLSLKGVVPDFPDFRDSHQLQLAPFELAERSLCFFCARFPMETAIIQTLWEWWWW